ncbi:MAG: carboxypeptidase-like regulatory domain-containing protein [Kofleriaceae bacterium]
MSHHAAARLATVAGLLALACPLTASAERITGRVLARADGAPVEGAVVYLTAPDGASLTATTTADGRYGFDVIPGTYQVTFLYGDARQRGTVVVAPDTPMVLNGRLAVDIAETIVVDETHRPAVLPEPITPRFSQATPPYSDRAILHDVWTRAWLLLSVDDTGEVTKLKLLRDPGYDLGPIAISEGFKLRFTPARDAAGNRVSTLVIWPIEWPAQSWLVTFQGQATRMPEAKPMSSRSQASYVPCKGSGPWRLGSQYKGYRDCARPDLAAAKTVPWILRTP